MPATQLTPAQKKRLRQQAHSLKPTLLMGYNGLTDKVIAQFDDHMAKRQLAKVKLPDTDREERRQIATSLSHATASHLVQIIGRTATFYREPSSN